MKKTLKIVLVLALALVMVFTLAACKHDCAKDGHDYVDGVCKHCGEEESAGGGGGGEIPAGLPVADGKVVMYLTLKDIELASRNSIFLCGPMNYTAESTHFGETAAEMSRLGETNVYYVVYTAEQITAALAEGVTNSGEYQLVLGWNASSGVPAGKQGVNWSFKFDQETTGEANPSWANLYTAGAQAINLGDVKFTCGQPPVPVKITKTTLSVTLTEALPDGWVLVMPGTHIDWVMQAATEATETAPAKQSTIMTPNADRTVWTLEVKDVYEGEYEYQILACKAEGPINWGNHYSNAPSGNETIELSGADNNAIVPLYGAAISFPESTFADAVYKLRIKFADALPTGCSVAIYGGMNGWSNSDLSKCMFVVDETDPTIYTLEIAAKNGDQFKVVIYSAEQSSENQWTGTEEVGDGELVSGNAVIVIPDGTAVGAVIDIFGADYTIAYPATPAE